VDANAGRHAHIEYLLCVDSEFRIPGPLAETYADRIDWHQIDRLMRRDCPPRLVRRPGLM
jgi:hypothetical protein